MDALRRDRAIIYGIAAGIAALTATWAWFGAVNATLVEAYTKEQGLFRTDATPDPLFSDSLELDLATVEPSLAGPSRPQDRVRLADVKKTFLDALPNLLVKGKATLSNAEKAEIAMR